MRDLYIVGAGGHGRETLDIVEAVNRVHPTWRFAGFLDDGEPDQAVLHRRGAAVVGPVDRLGQVDGAFVLGVGGGPAHVRVHRRISAWATGEAAILVHPTAVLGADVRLSPGVLVAAGSHLTTNVEIGPHTHVNVACSVHHDATVGALVTLSPRVLLNGDVVVEDEAWLGPGAIVGRGVRIGRQAVVGAGAVVLDDVRAGARVHGVPAREVRTP